MGKAVTIGHRREMDGRLIRVRPGSGGRRHRQGQMRGRLGMMNGRTLSFDGGTPVRGAARVDVVGAMRIADAARV